MKEGIFIALIKKTLMISRNFSIHSSPAILGPASAIQVITAGNDHSFQLNESALKKILLDRKVKDHKVIVISIAGAYRTGKSFLLNFFLRYLYSKVSANCWSVCVSFLFCMSASNCRLSLFPRLYLSVPVSATLYTVFSI